MTLPTPDPGVGDTVSPQGLCIEGYRYPYPVSYITLGLQGETMKMEYMDIRSDHPNGHTILLLHGKNFFRLYWGPTRQLLANKGYRVIIPDQIGFGKGVGHIPHMESFDAFAKPLVDFLGN